MANLTKKRKEVNTKVDAVKLYELAEACSLVKQVSTPKFDASVDLHVRLGIDPRKADQAIRGTVTLPHGTGKTKRVLVLCTPEKEAEATGAGADYVGLDEYIAKIEAGWTDVDVIVAMPTVMAKKECRELFSQHSFCISRAPKFISRVSLPRSHCGHLH